MSRSLKKGPFADDHLLKKIDAMNAACCSAFDGQQSHFAGGQLYSRIFAFFCHQLCHIACGTNQLAA